jgi:glycogen operon protein
MRHPTASVNFITAHDGFTLRDLVSYNDKHNEANGEDNRDGSNDNHSWNHGAEGETDDPDVLQLRLRQECNFLATLMLSQGVPMLCGGDEIGRTQRGNNNGYAQDNDISWFDWDLDERGRALLEFTKRLIRLRARHPNFHRRRFFQDRRIDPDAPDRAINGGVAPDILWLRPDSKEMTQDEWQAGWIRSFGMWLNGGTLDEVNVVGEPVTDDSFLLLFNPHHEHVRFVLPKPAEGKVWEVCFDTKNVMAARRGPARKFYNLIDRSMAVLQEVPVDSIVSPTDRQ